MRFIPGQDPGVELQNDSPLKGVENALALKMACGPTKVRKQWKQL